MSDTEKLEADLRHLREHIKADLALAAECTAMVVSTIKPPYAVSYERIFEIVVGVIDRGKQVAMMELREQLARLRQEIERESRRR